MAKTRLQIRELVRSQLDMDSDELPNTLLDPWIEDGYARTLGVEERWPFFEHKWTIVTVADQVEYTKSTLTNVGSYALDQITSVVDLSEAAPRVLVGIAHDVAEVSFVSDSSAVPAYWSEWGGSVHVWPSPMAGRTLRVRGYRKPLWASGDAVVVDADERLHMALYFFVCSMAYAQQEDDVLAAFYMGQWQEAVGRAHETIMVGPQRRPVILSGTRLSASHLWGFNQ